MFRFLLSLFIHTFIGILSVFVKSPFGENAVRQVDSNGKRTAAAAVKTATTTNKIFPQLHWSEKCASAKRYKRKITTHSAIIVEKTMRAAVAVATAAAAATAPIWNKRIKPTETSQHSPRSVQVNFSFSFPHNQMHTHTHVHFDHEDRTLWKATVSFLFSSFCAAFYLLRFTFSKMCYCC